MSPEPDRRRAAAAQPGAAFYSHDGRRLGDWWTLLHPPYTLWHLSYVVIGACLAPQVDLGRLLLTLGAFFAAVGVGAHAFDELHGHPLRTRIPDRILIIVGALGVSLGVACGVVLVVDVGWRVAPFVAVGPMLVLAYDLEFGGGRLHTDAGFAAAWGAFPVLAAYAGQTGTLLGASTGAALIAAGGAFALSRAQRALSTRARSIRRQADTIDGTITFEGRAPIAIDGPYLLAPIEHALRWLSWATVAFATALAVARMT